MASLVSVAVGLALAVIALTIVGMSRPETTAISAAPVRAPLGPVEAESDGEGGIATIEPARLTTGVTDTFCLVYAATQRIADTGGMRIVDPGFHGTRWTMRQELQKTKATEPGYLNVPTTGSAGLFIAPSGSSNPQYESDTVIRVMSGAGAVGDEVILCVWRGASRTRRARALSGRPRQRRTATVSPPPSLSRRGWTSWPIPSRG